MGGNKIKWAGGGVGRKMWGVVLGWLSSGLAGGEGNAMETVVGWVVLCCGS